MGKKILVFSMGPIFRDYVHGGSQKILREVLEHLGKQGHKVDVLCTQRDDNKDDFMLFENVEVHPSLRFKQTFPAPYRTSPSNIADVITQINRHLRDSDVLYVHDSNLNVPVENGDTPTVWSLRDFVYPESLVGGFCFERDKLIVNSEYARDCVRASVGRIKRGLDERLVVIENGINSDLFARTDHTQMRKIVGLEDGTIPILYPHRPEPNKGIFKAFEVINRIKKRGLDNVRLLVSNYIDTRVSTELAKHYAQLEEVSREMGIRGNIVFHDWVPYELMPAYYSLGKVSLNVGNFIEFFGSNTVLEAIACGVYPVVARVGALRNTLPDELLSKVEYGDIDAIERMVLDVLDGKMESDVERLREYVTERFSHKGMVEAYEQAITGASVLPRLSVKTDTPILERSYFMIAPWCHISEKGIYHDYHYGHGEVDDFYLFVRANNGRFPFSEALKQKIDKERIQAELDKGTIIFAE